MFRVGRTLAGAAVGLLTACAVGTPTPEAALPADNPPPLRAAAAQPTTEVGRILARPGAPSAAGPAGLRPLGLASARDGLLYVPSSYRPDRPAPLALLLHGAGGVGQHGLDLLRPLAEESGMLLVAPDSRGPTWDAVMGGYGPDVAFVDLALSRVFASYRVDPTRLAVGGFSDGASYALSLGVTNGDLFTHVLAFSPGFMAPAAQRGAPRLFVSHGTGDAVLPIDACSRRIVPQVRRAGYDVLYREFDGPHSVPPAIAGEAAAWFLAGGRR